MSHAQPRKQEPTFRTGLQQLKHGCFGGQKVRPTSAQVTSYQSTCNCSATESSSKYPAEQENAYEQDVSGCRYSPQFHEYISEEDEDSSYSKVSENGRHRHGMQESLPHGYYNTTEHKMLFDESEYTRKGSKNESDYGFPKVAQSSRIPTTSSGIKQQVVIPSHGGGRMYQDRAEENNRLKVQAPPTYGGEKMYCEFMVDDRHEVPSQGGGRMYEDRVEENYRRKVQAPPMYGSEKMHGQFMVDKKREVHRIQNGHYRSTDAEYVAHHGPKITYMPQPAIITEDEAYERRTGHRYDLSGSKYLRPTYWKQELETVMGTDHEQFTEKKKVVKTKRDAKLKIGISGKLKL